MRADLIHGPSCFGFSVVAWSSNTIINDYLIYSTSYLVTTARVLMPYSLFILSFIFPRVRKWNEVLAGLTVELRLVLATDLLAVAWNFCLNNRVHRGDFFGFKMTIFHYFLFYLQKF